LHESGYNGRGLRATDIGRLNKHIKRPKPVRRKRKPGSFSSENNSVNSNWKAGDFYQQGKESKGVKTGRLPGEKSLGGVQ